jgi:probable addiction module antidote protein
MRSEGVMARLPKGFKKLDIADYLKTEDDIAGFLKACFEEAGDDPAYIADALGVAARARGMTALAKEAGVTRSESTVSNFPPPLGGG